MDNRPIGLIDSGVGGLTVVKEALRQLPNESLLFFGDSARNPYGPRPREQISNFTWQLTHFLLKKDIKMLVVACNTATAASLDELKDQLPIPVIGVILPGSRAAIRETQNNRIGVIGTEGTIKSDAYCRSLKNKSDQIDVHSLACPRFVSLVESNQYKSSVAKKVVSETLEPLTHPDIDTMILGCTHYPLLSPLIQNYMGKKIRLIDSGAETVNEVSVLLDYYDLAASPVRKNEGHHLECFTTGSANNFKAIASQWLGFDNVEVKHVPLKEIENA